MIRALDDDKRSRIRSMWVMRQMDTRDIGVMIHVDECNVEREINRFLDERWRASSTAGVANDPKGG